MPKFLIIRFSSIGDIIQCMGIIDGIREHFPDAEIHWIARKDMSSFLAMDKRIGKIWAFDKALGLKGLLKIARQLREEHYDYIYDAHSNIRSNILRLKLFDSLVLILTPSFPQRIPFTGLHLAVLDLFQTRSQFLSCNITKKFSTVRN